MASLAVSLTLAMRLKGRRMEATREVRNMVSVCMFLCCVCGGWGRWLMPYVVIRIKVVIMGVGE